MEEAAAVSALRASLASPALRDLGLSVMRAELPAPGTTLLLHLPHAARTPRAAAASGGDAAARGASRRVPALRYTRPQPSTPLDELNATCSAASDLTALQMAGAALGAMSGGALWQAADAAADFGGRVCSWPHDPPSPEAPAGDTTPLPFPRWHLGRDFGHAETWAAAVEWAAPVLFSVLPVDSVLLLVGAALTEHSIVLVGGELSLEAVSSCALALACLLQPLSWASAAEGGGPRAPASHITAPLPLPLSSPGQVGAFQPVLPEAMAHLLDAPTPILVGVARLPADFVQDDRTIVALLDRETVRVRHTASEGGGAAVAVTAAATTDSGRRGALESHADVLRLQLPGNSALYGQLEPVASLLRMGSGSGSGATIASDPTARPCYRPTPTQRDAAVLLCATICCYVRGLLAAAFTAGETSPPVSGRGGARPLPPLPLCRARLLASCSESEAPFWDALLGTQMLAYLVECQDDLSQAAT